MCDLRHSSIVHADPRCAPILISPHWERISWCTEMWKIPLSQESSEVQYGVKAWSLSPEHLPAGEQEVIKDVSSVGEHVLNNKISRRCERAITDPVQLVWITARFKGLWDEMYFNPTTHLCPSFLKKKNQFRFRIYYHIFFRAPTFNPLKVMSSLN